jgi:hypothetical protein
MDVTTFDTITRSIATSQTRRSALQGLVAGAATLVAGGILLQHEDASAKRRRGKKKKRKNKNKNKGKGNGKNTSPKLQPGELCQSDEQCTAGFICAVPSNAGNSDKRCSAGLGTTCGAPNGDGDATPPFCAGGLACAPTGNTYTCQPEK